MIKTCTTFLRRTSTALMISATVLLAAPAARADAGFQTWINSFYATAAKSGISKATYQKAFSGVKTPDPTVLEKARYQPEFKHKIWEYIDIARQSVHAADRQGNGRETRAHAGCSGASFRR